MTHSFTRVYLNQFVMAGNVSIRDRILDQIVRSREVLGGGEIEKVEVLPRLSSSIGADDCKAFFWIRAVRKPALDGRYYLILETYSVSAEDFLKTYFVWDIDGRKMQTWPASYDNPISGSKHTITLTKYISKTEIYKYTRSFDISMNTPTGETSCSQ